MIYVHVRNQVKPGMREAYIEAIKKTDIAHRTQNEPDNICYEFFCSVENEDEVFLLECWENEAALIPHQEEEHFKELQAIKSDYVLKTEVEKIAKFE